jgi:hypothetical protein
MTLIAKQVRIASRIDARMQTLIHTGRDDMAILAAMADHMPAFKRLLDITQPGDMDELTRRFTGFCRFSQILGTLATGIHSGAIKAPR